MQWILNEVLNEEEIYLLKSPLIRTCGAKELKSTNLTCGEGCWFFRAMNKLIIKS